MDSIWFKFSVETMVTNGHGRKVRRKSQGENRRDNVTRQGKPGVAYLEDRNRP
jgi:hypothetical protein